MKKRDKIIKRILELRKDTHEIRFTEEQRARICRCRGNDPIDASTYAQDSYENLLRILENHIRSNVKARYDRALRGLAIK